MGIRGGFCVQPKCDGISLEMIYKDGQFIEAITRGDGEVGDVITQREKPPRQRGRGIFILILETLFQVFLKD